MKRIQKIEWSRAERARRSERTQLRDQENDSVVRERDYSEKIAETIDSEILGLLTGAMEKARAMIQENRPMLDKVAEVLLEKETLEKDEFEALFGGPKKTAHRHGTPVSIAPTA